MRKTRGTIELVIDARVFTSIAAPNASFNHFGAYVEGNGASGHEKKYQMLPGKRTQGTLARLREAKVGTGSFLAKS